MDRLITRKCDLSIPADRAWIIEQVASVSGLPFEVEELRSILDSAARMLDKEWLTIYGGGMLGLKIGPKQSHGLHFFKHLVPLGFGLCLLEDKLGFKTLLRKLNQPTYDRLSCLLEAFAAARYVAAGYDVDLEPRTPEGKRSDFRVLYGNEWIYFECKTINVRENLSIKRNNEFIGRLLSSVLRNLEGQIPSDYRIEIRLDKKPNSHEIVTILDDLKERVATGRYDSWVKTNFGEYAVVRRQSEAPQGYATALMQITVGTTPTLLSLNQASACVFYDSSGSKVEQRFRTVLKLAKKQIPSESRGILIIQGLDENKAARILQERLGQPEYYNIIAGVAIRNGAISVRRDNHADVPNDFIGKCISYSLFYGYDIGNY